MIKSEAALAADAALDAEAIKPGTVFALIGGEHVDLSTVTLPDNEEIREWARSHWVLHGSVIEIDLAGAKDQARDEIEAIRRERQQEMNDRFMAALQNGQDATAAATDAKWMRALSSDPRVDAAATPEALKSTLDAILSEIAAR